MDKQLQKKKMKFKNLMNLLCQMKKLSQFYKFRNQKAPNLKDL